MSDRERDARDDRMVDWLLGELPADAARGLSRETVQDAGAAHAVAELRGLFDDLRELSVEPTSQVSVALRRSIGRRLQLRQGGAKVRRRAMLVCLEVAAVAAVTLAALVIGDRWWQGRSQVGESREAVVDRLPQGLDSPPAVSAPAGSPAVSSPAVSSPAVWPPAVSPPAVSPDVTDGSAAQPLVAPTVEVPTLLLAMNDLASLRREFKSRFDPLVRRRAILAAGGSAHLEARIADLADDVAVKIEAALGAGKASVQDVSLSLRALLAAGSSKRMGRHQAAVRLCSAYLEGRVAELSGGELATALSGLMDVAVVYGGRLAELVKTHTDRLVEPLRDPDPDHRPDLLHWRTAVGQLADAGHVLRQAPAFGVDAVAAIRGQSYIAAHVAERIALRTDERPDLLAALLYGFGERVDRDRIEHKLGLWRARDLVPDHYVALHHVSWSRFPLRAGWAGFQRDLRRVSALKTPDSVTDVAALLLCLAVNYAAPGCQQLVDVVASR